jgi:signal transduction histidine kinase
VWWQAEPRGGEVALEPGELNDEARRQTLRFPAPGDALRVVRKRHGCDALALNEEGDMLGRQPCEVPESLWSTPDLKAAAIVNVRFADHWSGRVVLLFDRVLAIGDVRLLQRLICQATPVMYAHYLVRRLRTRVARTERLRVARELHDGVIQSLAGLEMRVDALRRTRADALRAAGLDDDLLQIQRLLGDEARAVRDLMHQIRPLEIAQGQIVRVFADLVSRFERESGVTTRFTADDDGADVPPPIARELGRTLQEALRNVRKHGDAKHVDVTFKTDNGNWKLIVANDGRPFDFRGLWTLEELEARLRGPRVIKERVREMGGDLTIESTPAKGVRLEVTIPRKRSLLATLS